MQEKKPTKSQVLSKIRAFIDEKIKNYNQKIDRNIEINSRGQIANKINNQSLVTDACMWAVCKEFGKKKGFVTRSFLARRYEKSLPTIDTLLAKLKLLGFKIERGLNKFKEQILNCMKFEFPQEILDFFDLCGKGEMPPLTPTEPKKQQEKQEEQQEDLLSVFRRSRKN